MTWLMESPFWIVLLGVLFCIVLAAAWVASGRRELLYTWIGAFVLTAILLIAERYVVTDREAIEATLHQIAADVKSNNRAAVMSHIYSGAPQIKQQAQAEMPNYSFNECRVNKIHLIEVNAQDHPRSAVAEFNVYVNGTFSVQGFSGSGDYWRFVRLNLRQEQDGAWRVEDYHHEEPTSFLFDRPGNP